MKFWGIYRFEVFCQLRTISTWICYIALLLFAFLIMQFSKGNHSGYYDRCPQIALATVSGSLLWLLVAATVAGDAAARDLQTRMYSLTYTTPVNRFGYMGARFLAAFTLNALIKSGIPAGIMLSIYIPGGHYCLSGPFPYAAYGSTYGLMALAFAFVATAIQFSVALVFGRSMAGHIGTILLLVMAVIIRATLALVTGEWHNAKLLDLTGIPVL